MSKQKRGKTAPKKILRPATVKDLLNPNKPLFQSVGKGGWVTTKDKK